MRMRPKKRNETLSQYADAVIDDFRMKVAASSPSVAEAWKKIFDALCDEGQHMRLVSPAAVVIYQRYFNAAVHFLGEYPDDDRLEALVRRVQEDVVWNESQYTKLINYRLYRNVPRKFDGCSFSEAEHAEGAKAIYAIKSKLRSFA